MPGTLYVVATPIGNLEDFSPRGRRVLGEVAVIAAEDTRVTRKLLTHFEIRTPLTSFHAHSGPGKAAYLVERLLAGEDVALVSDAGTPGISDPGGELIREAVANGVVVVPIPGPSAVTTSLAGSGLDPSRFVFQGFLPRSAGDRRKALQPLRGLPHTLVFYEAPDRLPATLAALREILGNRSAVVARELTKKFEEFARGSLEELEARYRTGAARGECVVLVEGASAGSGEAEGLQDADAPGGTASAEKRARALLASGATVRDTAKALAAECGLARNDAYALARRIAEEP